MKLVHYLGTIKQKTNNEVSNRNKGVDTIRKKHETMAVLVAQFAEQLLPIPEGCSLNAVIDKKNNRTCLLLKNENKIKKKRPGTAPFKKETRVKNRNLVSIPHRYL